MKPESSDEYPPDHRFRFDLRLVIDVPFRLLAAAVAVLAYLWRHL